MADEIVFYTNPMSRGRITRWILEELGEPYRTEIIGYERMKSPDYLAINPMGKVPAITHGGAVITEGAAICTYLADAFPKAQLAPAIGDEARGAYVRWMFFAAGPLEAAVTDRALGWEPPADRSRMVGYGSFEQTIDVLARAVAEAPYIVGDRFTAADVFVGSQIGWGVLGVAKDRAPAFQPYLDRINSRPAAVRAREIDDGLLAEQKQREAQQEQQQ